MNIDKPTMVPINDQVGEQLNNFMAAFNEVVLHELQDIENEVESIKNVLKHHRTME